MISVRSLLDMVCTEAIEGGDIMVSRPAPENHHPDRSLPSIRYTLELIQGPNGEYVWVE